jgi:hypothetical protein
MQCMDLATGLATPSMLGKKAYERLFDAGLTASNIEALDALFLDIGSGSRRELRRRKPTTYAALPPISRLFTTCVILKLESSC